MSYVFKGQVKIEDVQKAFDSLVDKLNTEIDTYNTSISKKEDVDYNVGSDTLAPYGYTLTVGGLKKVMDELAGTTLGCNVYRQGSESYIVSDGIHFNEDYTVDRLPHGTIGKNDPYNFYQMLYGNATLDRQNDTYTIDNSGVSTLRLSSSTHDFFPAGIDANNLTFRINGAILIPFNVDYTYTLPADLSQCWVVHKNADGSFTEYMRIHPADFSQTYWSCIQDCSPTNTSYSTSEGKPSLRHVNGGINAGVYQTLSRKPMSSNEEVTFTLRSSQDEIHGGEAPYVIYSNKGGYTYRSYLGYMGTPLSEIPQSDTYILIPYSGKPSILRAQATPEDYDFSLIESKEKFLQDFPNLINYVSLGNGFTVYWDRDANRYTINQPSNGYLVRYCNRHRDIPYCNTGKFLAENPKGLNIYAGGSLSDSNVDKPDIGGERFVIPDVQCNNGSVIVYLLGRIIGWKGNWGGSTSQQAWNWTRIFLPKGIRNPITYSNDSLKRTKFVSSKKVRK